MSTRSPRGEIATVTPTQPRNQAEVGSSDHQKERNRPANTQPESDPVSTLEARIAEVLEEHTLHMLSMETDDPNGAWVVECNCDTMPFLADGHIDGEKKFAAHQAAALLTLIREREAEAFDLAADCAPEYMPRNPYRATS